jgi:superfamily II DNA or RNA helicase
LFDTVMPSPQGLQGYVAQGLLKELEYVSVPHAGLTGVYLDMLSPKTYPEDYVSGELYRRLVSQECTASLFKAYKEHADNKRGIVYAFNDTHAQAIADYYSRHGVPAKVFYGNLPSKPKFPIEDFRSGDLKVLVDVHGVSTDYPLPEVQFVQLAYPTQLLSEYLNMVETRMRVSSDFTDSERVKDGDSKLLVIDHVKMRDTFGLPTDERDWLRLFAERCIETEREPAKPKNSKSRRSSRANGHAVVATKWQQRMERLLNAPPVHRDLPDETVKV